MAKIGVFKTFEDTARKLQNILVKLTFEENFAKNYIDVESPSDGNVIAYNTTDRKWEDFAVSAGSNTTVAVSDANKTITVAAPDAITDNDFSSNGYMRRTGSGTYTTDVVTTVPMIVLGVASAQNVDSTSFTDIDFDSEPGGFKDSAFTHSTSTNPENITINEDGVYKIEGYISVEESITANYRWSGECAVAVNGSYRDGIYGGYIRMNGGADETNVAILDVGTLSSGDTVKVGVKRISSTSGAATTAVNKTKIMITRIR